MPVSREDCASLDARDALAHTRDRFVLPEHIIYLDGNSLGPLPKTAAPRIADVIAREWGCDLIGSWNRNDWIGLPARLGALVAPLIGAAPDEVIVADSTSANLFKLAAAALRLKRPRTVILSEEDNFPTDLYILQGLREFVGGGVELRLASRERLVESIDDNVALVALTHIHYKTGAVHDMAAVNRRGHERGALTLWDLSHSAGAAELFLNRDGADLAVGCGYKYLNGGPGAPAFLYAVRHLQPELIQPLSGWMGHAAPFDFAPLYAPASGMTRHLCGTPVVLGMAALEEGLKTFAGIDMRAVDQKAQALGDLFLQLVEERCRSEFVIGCPGSGKRRGSQVALRHPDGYAIMQALIEDGVIGDFRAPDVMRFGLAPLYTRYVDMWDAVERLTAVMRQQIWRADRFRIRAAVT